MRAADRLNETDVVPQGVEIRFQDEKVGDW